MADLSCYATKEKADEGIWCPVRIDGDKIPLAVKVYGSDSDTVKDYERAKIRKIGKNMKGNKIDEDAIDEMLDSQDTDVLIRIAEISSYDWKKKENTDEAIILNGRTVENDKKSYAFLLENFPALKDFILEKSNERANFLSNGKKN